MNYGRSRVYYADGSSREANTEDEILSLPKVGVIAINQDIDGMRSTMFNHDFYWILNEEWLGGDRHGADMYLMQSGYKILFYGMYINSHIFDSIMQTVYSDPDFSKVSI